MLENVRLFLGIPILLARTPNGDLGRFFSTLKHMRAMFNVLNFTKKDTRNLWNLYKTFRITYIICFFYKEIQKTRRSGQLPYLKCSLKKHYIIFFPVDDFMN